MYPSKKTNSKSSTKGSNNNDLRSKGDKSKF